MKLVQALVAMIGWVFFPACAVALIAASVIVFKDDVSTHRWLHSRAKLKPR
jgi:hypothetical protein